MALLDLEQNKLLAKYIGSYLSLCFAFFPYVFFIPEMSISCFSGSLLLT